MASGPNNARAVGADSFEKWITETRSQCPHCREPLHIYELINCRWADEVTQQLENLQTQTSVSLNHACNERGTGTSSKDTCESHQEHMSVFCSTCDIAICHKCALFDGKHSQHCFRQLDDVYHEHVRRIQTEMERLTCRHSELFTLFHEVEQNVQNVKQSKDKRVRELHNAVELMITRLDSQLKSKLVSLMSQRSQLFREIELLEALLKDIQGELETVSKAEIISRSSEILAMFTEIHRKPMSAFVSDPVPADFVSEIVPHYDSSSFTLQPYSILRQRADPIYSPPLHVGGISWRLKIYPDGNGVVRGNYLSVFLELSAGLLEASNQYRSMNHTEWLELESDPGLFTLLLEDFGVKGVQVEEVYDLSMPIPETVYGFIFLFRWDNTKKKSSRRSGRSSTGASASLASSTNNNPLLTPSVNTTVNGTNEWKDSATANTPVSSQIRSNAGYSCSTFDQPYLSNDSSTSQAGMGQSSGNSVPHQPPEIFFAHQSVQNSCATHALLSILFNRPGLELGSMLTDFHEATRHLTPEEKGLAIGSMPQLADAHNRHAAKPPWLVTPSKQASSSPYEAATAVTAALGLANVTSTTSFSCSASVNTSVGGGGNVVGVTANCYQPSSHNSSLTMADCVTVNVCPTSSGGTGSTATDTFHFVCYLPIGEQLYELDGLKPEPVNHGSIKHLSTWTDHCVDILRLRMREQDLRYSLLAVVPDRRIALIQRMETLEKNRSIIERILGHQTAHQQPSPVESMPCDALAGHHVNKRDEEEEEEGEGDQENVETRQLQVVTAEKNRTEPDVSTGSEPTRSILTRAASRLASLPQATSAKDSLARDTTDPTYAGTPPPAPRKRELADSQLPVETRSCSVGDPGEQETSWLSIGNSCKRQRLHSPSNLPGLEASELVTKIGIFPDSYGHGGASVHKLFPALSMSAHSPLLTTLTETVAALAAEKTRDWRSVGQQEQTAGNLVNPVESQPDGLLTSGLDTDCAQRPGYPDKSLTQPLTIDTSPYNPGDPVPCSSSSLGNSGGGKRRRERTPDPVQQPEATDEESLRPQTRALTRARGHSSLLRPTLSSSSSSNGRWSSTALLDVGSRWKPEAEEIAPGHTVKTDQNHVWTGSFNGSEAEDAEGVGRRVPSKYPTRSSTRRDTLASHSLAHLRSAGNALTSPLTVDTTRLQTGSDSMVKPSPGGNADAQISSGSSQASPLMSTSLAHTNNNCSPTESSPGVVSSIGGRAKLLLGVPRRLTTCHLQVLLGYVEKQTKDCEVALVDEAKKRARYRQDDARRVHNYEPFIRAFLTALSDQGTLRSLVMSTLQKKQNNPLHQSCVAPPAGQKRCASSLASPRLRSPKNESVSVSLVSTADSSPSSASVTNEYLYLSPSCLTRVAEPIEGVGSNSSNTRILHTSNRSSPAIGATSSSTDNLPSPVASRLRLWPKQKTPGQFRPTSQPITRSRSALGDEFSAETQLSSSTLETTSSQSPPGVFPSDLADDGDSFDVREVGKQTRLTLKEIPTDLTVPTQALTGFNAISSNSCPSDLPESAADDVTCVNSLCASTNSQTGQSTQDVVTSTSSLSDQQIKPTVASPNPTFSFSATSPPSLASRLSSAISSTSSLPSPKSVFTSGTRLHSGLGNSTSLSDNASTSPRRSSRSRYSSPKLSDRARESVRCEGNGCGGNRTAAPISSSSALSCRSFSAAHSLRRNSRRHLNTAGNSHNNANNGSLRSSVDVKLGSAPVDRRPFSVAFSHRRRHLC